MMKIKIDNMDIVEELSLPVKNSFAHSEDAIKWAINDYRKPK